MMIVTRFQSSRSEEVGCGFFAGADAKWLSFQSSRSEEVGCGTLCGESYTVDRQFQSSRSEEAGCGQANNRRHSGSIKF